MALGSEHDNRLCTVNSAQFRRDRPDWACEAGFSLLEVMVSLVILSLVSLATFQSITTMSALSDRANHAAERSIERTLDYAGFDAIISAAVPKWQGEPGDAMAGNAERLVLTTALTRPARSRAVQSEAGDEGAALINRLRLVEIQIEEGYLVIKSEGDALPMSFVGQEAALSYLGTDRIWYSAWPPERSLPYGPEAAKPNDDYQLSGPPQFPLAVRLSLTDGRIWISRPRQAPELPPTGADEI